jgi:hypothetical protein
MGMVFWIAAATLIGTGRLAGGDFGDEQAKRKTNTKTNRATGKISPLRTGFLSRRFIIIN